MISEGVKILSNNKRNMNQSRRSGNYNRQGNTRKNRPQNDAGGSNNYARKSSKAEYQKKSSQRYNSDSVVSRIANPKREETIEDIRMYIEKREKEIQFEIKQIRSTKLGL